MTSPPPDRDALRRDMRRARAALAPQQITESARALCRHVHALGAYGSAGSVAGYLAMPGEMDLQATLRMALADGKTCYVPIIDGQQLRFAPWTPASAMRESRFGILEPVVEEALLVKPEQLQLVLVPLVAFDAQCNRLGMGGGYYDRSFAHHRERKLQTLVGVAHELQKLPALDAQSWDVPLDCIVTESNTYWPPAD